MPLWRPKPKQETNEQQNSIQIPSADTELDRFLSHFEKEGDTFSPFGEINMQEQLTIPRTFIPPTAQQIAPQLPGMTSVPEQATTGEHITHIDSTEMDMAIKALVELECFNLIPLYEQIGKGDKSKTQFEKIIKLAVQGRKGPGPITGEATHELNSYSRGRVIEDLEFDISTKNSGALSDEVFKSLVEKIFNCKGTLPPIGIGAKPKAYYMGRLVAFKGVSPNIKVYKDFLSELEARRSETPKTLATEIEDLIITRNPDKYNIIKKIRDRLVPAFTAYEKSNLGRKNKDIYNFLVANAIANQYHCVELRFDVSDFIDTEATRHINVNEISLARALLLLKTDPRTTKKKSADASINTSLILPKETLGRIPISLITSVSIESPNGNLIEYGVPNIEYPKSGETCLILSHKIGKNSEILLVESFNLLYSLLRPLEVNEVLGYLD
jgi:hypothetical protein